jgi:putative flavoprotein involved in K+ transport
VTVEGERVAFDDSVTANVAAGDVFAARARAMIDELIRRGGLDAPPADPDEHDAHADLDPPVALDLRAEEVGSVGWCTGLAGDYSWLDPPWSTPTGSSGMRTPPRSRRAAGPSACAD